MLYSPSAVSAVVDDLDRALVADGDAGEHEAKRDEDAAGGDERDHVRDTGHQPLADLGRGARVGLDLGGERRRHAPAARRLRRRPPCDGSASHSATSSSAWATSAGPSEMPRLTPTSTVRLAGEPAGVLDREVVGEDHGVGGGDLLGGERVGAGRALGLDGHRVARGLRGVLETLGGHVGVGDAGGARGDADELERALRRRGGGCRRGGGAVSAAAARRRPRRRSRRVPGPWPRPGRAPRRGRPRRSTRRTTSSSVVASARACLKSFFISARASFGSICMCASPPLSGAAMRKTSVAGPSLAPQSMPSPARPKTSEGSVIGGAAGVRDADAAGQAGRHLGLALADVGEEGVEVGAATGGDEPLGEGPGGLVAVGTGEVEDDLLLGDEGHGVPFGGHPTRRRVGSGVRVRWTGMPREVLGAGTRLPGRVTAAAPQVTAAARASAAGESARQAVEQAGEHAVAGAHGGQGVGDRGRGVDLLVGGDEEGAVAAEAHGDDLDAVGDEVEGGGADVAEGRQVVADELGELLVVGLDQVRAGRRRRAPSARRRSRRRRGRRVHGPRRRGGRRGRRVRRAGGCRTRRPTRRRRPRGRVAVEERLHLVGRRARGRAR